MALQPDKDHHAGFGLFWGENNAGYHFVNQQRLVQLVSLIIDYDTGFEQAAGDFLHAQEDTFAHCGGELDRNFDYYGGEDGGLFGHGFEGHSPDFTWGRPVKAMRMSERVYADLRNIIQNDGRYANPEQATAPGVTDQHWGTIADTVRRFLEFPDNAGNIGGAARVTETATGFNMTRASTLAKVQILFPGLTLPANLDRIADEDLTVDQVDFKRLPSELGHRPGTYRSFSTPRGAELLMSPLPR